jgi:hypothetical protein
MLMSQRYPLYFDGIVAGAPAMRTGRSNLAAPLRWRSPAATPVCRRYKTAGTGSASASPSSWPSAARDMAEAPGGRTGLFVRQYQCGALALPVYKVDTGLVSLLSELRAHEQQAATELEQWKIRTVVEATIAVTPAAIALSQLLTTHELKELKRKILEAEA